VTTTIGNWEYVFDDVQFAIDVKAWRTAQGVTQDTVARMVGFDSSGVLCAIETGRYDKHISFKTFMRLVKLCDLNPHDYFDLQHS
jgi:DNA-binding XRE family transcriptional regulator